MSILRKLLIYVTTTLGLISVVYAKDNFEAEDMLQVAFVKVFEKLKDY